MENPTNEQLDVEDIRKTKKPKSYTGCYTCRRRKIACDMGKPTCLKCQKSGFFCEGYDVKLRWSHPVEFDVYGYQLPSKTPPESEYCQRRSIANVKYDDKSAYQYYEDMDLDLANLHNSHITSLKEPTKFKGHFGVFRGSKLMKKKRRRRTASQMNKKQCSKPALQLNNIKETTPRSIPSFTEMNKVDNMNMAKETSGGTIPQPNFLYPENASNKVAYGHNSTYPSMTKSTAPIGNEWLSTELLDAALLTASALNGDTHFFDMFDLDHNTHNTNHNSATLVTNNTNTKDDENTSGTKVNIANTIYTRKRIIESPKSNKGVDLFPETVPDQMLHLLFQGRNITTNNFAQPQQRQHQIQSQEQLNQFNPQSSNGFKENSGKLKNNSQFPNNITMSSIKLDDLTKEEIASVVSHNSVPSVQSFDDHSDIRSSNMEDNSIVSTGILPTTNQNNKFRETNQPIIDNNIQIHASETIRMPKHIMEILETTPLPKSIAIDKFGIPTTSLNVQPMARYLLNYYIEDVADMMTVIPLAKNPWKFIYFPRALMAIGELSSLGKTSNARNGLLNALLAVSAFNLQSKFVRGSDEMKFYVDLGIQLRRQANEFVERCMEEDILNQKYKDVLTAVLSMVTIDVVWGTMSSCKIHLDHCERIIEKKMQHKKKLSSKAMILHRIFSSLKLIQDSTSFENIQKSEIFLNENNYKNFLTGAKPTYEQLEQLNKNNFRDIFKGANAVRANKATSGISKFSLIGNDSAIILNTNDMTASPTSRSNSRDQSSNSGFQSGYKKKGKYNEKITDNGKVRIEFIVNNDDEIAEKNDQKLDNDITKNVDIPAFVDITKQSFQPSKNKLDDKVVSSDAIYGLPNSLILLFGEIVPLTRFKRYHEDHKIPLPVFFDDLAEQLEFKLLTWKLEWTLTIDDEIGTMNDDDSSDKDDSNYSFISPRHEGIYHHVMSFYHALVIYFYRFIENVNPMYLLKRIEQVLYHLNKIQDILEKNKETSYIIPLFWQGFIAGSEAMTLYLQNGFNKWGQDIAQTGIGTYWNARQIMLEIWRRKNHNVKNSSWPDVLRDWKTNVMLT
ncbi:hypothetical protein CANINC_003124 [Pichia inconspicua]|uniref:Zn(2)-C6 fungal-type domain-containing protein n=1 Tax=Pichia inconspicua TaxID=52247 RepID=A0A4T0WZG3_9ASCO|nr:hypothetical protein CANINC_003124 [[Candida] inconspicua]